MGDELGELRVLRLLDDVGAVEEEPGADEGRRGAEEGHRDLPGHRVGLGLPAEEGALLPELEEDLEEELADAEALGVGGGADESPDEVVGQDDDPALHQPVAAVDEDGGADLGDEAAHPGLPRVHPGGSARLQPLPGDQPLLQMEDVEVVHHGPAVVRAVLKERRTIRSEQRGRTENRRVHLRSRRRAPPSSRWPRSASPTAARAS